MLISIVSHLTGTYTALALGLSRIAKRVNFPSINLFLTRNTEKHVRCPAHEIIYLTIQCHCS